MPGSVALAVNLSTVSHKLFTCRVPRRSTNKNAWQHNGLHGCKRGNASARLSKNICAEKRRLRNSQIGCSNNIKRWNMRRRIGRGVKRMKRDVKLKKSKGVAVRQKRNACCAKKQSDMHHRNERRQRYADSGSNKIQRRLHADERLSRHCEKSSGLQIQMLQCSNGP